MRTTCSGRSGSATAAGYACGPSPRRIGSLPRSHSRSASRPAGEAGGPARATARGSSASGESTEVTSCGAEWGLGAPEADRHALQRRENAQRCNQPMHGFPNLQRYGACEGVLVVSRQPLHLAVLERGVATLEDYLGLATALIVDLQRELVTPEQASTLMLPAMPKDVKIPATIAEEMCSVLLDRIKGGGGMPDAAR